MIQYSELMIGNWVSSKCHNGLYTEIFSVNHDSVRLGANPLAFYKSTDIEPIPLTIEIIEENIKEFKKSTWRSDTWVLRHDDSQFQICKHNDRLIFRGLGMSITYVDTVHHLQNLVAVNTGKPLEFNL